MGKRPSFLLAGIFFLTALGGFFFLSAGSGPELDTAAEILPGAPSASPFTLEAPVENDATSAISSSTPDADAAAKERATRERLQKERETEELAEARARSRSTAPVATAAPVAARPQRPGGSQLYTGGSRPLAPQLLLSLLDLEAKSAQNDRASDVADKRGTIIGSIASVDTGSIVGWAYDWNDLESVVAVDVYVDGTLILTVPANASRTAFDPTNPSNPIDQRAWICPSPAVLGDGNRHVVVALGYKSDSDSKTALQRSPWAFGGTQWPQGQLMWAAPNMVYGWASDPNNPTAPVTVSIVGDGVPIGKVTTQGIGQNAAIYAQALAAAPSKTSVIQLDGVSGPDDPNLGAALTAKVQSIQQANHYLDMRALSSATPGVAYDEYDFVAAVGTATPVPLPGTQRAAVKFWQVPDQNGQAFLLVASQPITASWLQVQVTTADGTITRDVQGSPMQIGTGGNRLPIGGVTFVSNVQITGWAADPDVLPAPISVDIIIDGAYFGRIVADQMFAALPNSVPSVGPQHAFVFAPPKPYLDGKTHTIQFFGVNQPDGVNPELGGSPVSFTGSQNSPPTGWLDMANTTGTAGWAYDADAGSAPVSVEIWIDNVLYKTVTANGIRPDLVPIVAPEPTHGFGSDVPATLTDGKFHTIRAFALNVPEGPKVELAGSPKEINAQQPLIGIWVRDGTQGLTISNVTQGLAGALAGMTAGDVIRAYDGNSLQVDYSTFIAWVATKEVGEQVVFRLWRDPTLPPAPTPNPQVPATQATPPLGANERLLIVTLGSK